MSKMIAKKRIWIDISSWHPEYIAPRVDKSDEILYNREKNISHKSLLGGCI